MMDDNNPYLPPQTVADESQLPGRSSEPKSHWFIRVMIIFIGAMMTGMAIALAFMAPGFFASLLGLAMLASGLILVRAGIIDRPPSLNFLNPARKPPRRRTW